MRISHYLQILLILLLSTTPGFCDVSNIWQQQPTFEKKLLEVGNKLVQQNGLDENRYLFSIQYNSNDANASIRDGQVFINDKLLNLIDNDDQLAFILAHELAHGELSHNARTTENIKETNRKIANAVLDASQEKVSQYQEERRQAISSSKTMAWAGVFSALAGYDYTTISQRSNDMATRAEIVYSQEITALIQNAASLIQQYQKNYLHSYEFTTFKQGLEKEADTKAIQLMCQAGYNPDKSLEVLRKVSNNYNEMLLDHPTYSDRGEVISQIVNSKICKIASNKSQNKESVLKSFPGYGNSERSNSQKTKAGTYTQKVTGSIKKPHSY